MMETCAVKIETEGNRPCGEPVEYLLAGARWNTHEGWHHVRAIVDHHHGAVPKSWV